MASDIEGLQVFFFPHGFLAVLVKGEMVTCWLGGAEANAVLQQNCSQLGMKIPVVWLGGQRQSFFVISCLE